MKQYCLNTKFNFGKHKSETLEQVAKLDNLYIEWCLLYHDNFLISDEVLNNIKKSIPDFSLSKLAEFARQLKLKKNQYPSSINNNLTWSNLVILKALTEIE